MKVSSVPNGFNVSIRFSAANKLSTGDIWSGLSSQESLIVGLHCEFCEPFISSLSTYIIGTICFLCVHSPHYGYELKRISSRTNL